MGIKKLSNNIEQISEEVHNAWMREKIEQGFHSPDECQCENHKHFLNADGFGKDKFEDMHNPKFYKWCDKCHTDLYPYSELPENIKEYDRVTVRAVIKAIEKLE